MATPGPAAEVESVKAAISKYFPVYDVRVSYDSLTFFITPEQSSLQEKFDQLRNDLKARMLVPVLRYQGGEYTINVVKRPELRARGLWLNGILLVVTLIIFVAMDASSTARRLDWIARTRPPIADGLREFGSKVRTYWVVSTIFGLIVAIPLLFVHTVLQSKTTRIIDSLEMVSVKFLNAVDERRRQQTAA